MNDIVIPYKRSTSGELAACLSLIRQNVPHRKIHIIEKNEPYRYDYFPHINQILKLKWALENLDITDDFYLFNDDFFVMKPVDSIPVYNRGMLSKQILEAKDTPYLKYLLQTMNYIGSHALSYELHLPMLMNSEKLAVLIDKLVEIIPYGKVPLIRSCYGNIYAVGGAYHHDVKHITEFEGETYLSSSEKSFAGSMGKYIRSKV